MYKYGMRLRGFSTGAQPKGFINWKDVDKSVTGYWSFVWYPFQLSEQDLKDYNLDFICCE